MSRSPVFEWVLPSGSLFQGMGFELGLKVRFSDPVSLVGMELIPSGTAQIGLVILESLPRIGNENNYIYKVPCSTWDRELFFGKAVLQYRVGTSTELLQKRLDFPKVHIVGWVWPFAVFLFLVFFITLMFRKIFRRPVVVETNNSSCFILSSEEKGELSRTLLEENYSRFFTRIREIEEKSAIEFPMELEKRDRIVYGGDRELLSRLSPALQHYFKQIDAEAEKEKEKEIADEHGTSEN